MSVNSKLAALADSIRAKSGAAGLLGLDAMKTSVDSIITPDEAVIYSQVNTAVKAYLDYVAAHPYTNDYSTSCVEQFTAGVTNGDKPLGAAVDISAGRLAVSDSLGGAELKAVTAGQQTIYNIAPTTDGGDYVNTDASGNVLACGHLVPIGALRMINCPQARNVRDLGGWACDGGNVKYGKIIRGGAVTLADREVLVNQLGVRVDLDVYCQGAELEWTQSPLGVDIKFVEAQNFNWYDLTDKTAWKVNIGAIFDAVAHNEPLYFHCGAGADRTGTLAVMVEALLGVSQSDIDADYELTSFYQRRTRVPDPTIPADLPSFINAIKSLGDGDLRDGAVNFVASLGFTAAEINAFRSTMIDGNPTTVTPDIDTFTVTNTLSHATNDNAVQSVAEYQPYTANITPNNGYEFENVILTMGGTDIKSTCYTQETYPTAKGKISIPNVTGNIAINATAVQSAPSYINLADPNSADWLDGYRFNSSGTPTAMEGCHIVNYIPCQQGDVVRIKGMSNVRSDEQVANTVCIYNASKEGIGIGNMSDGTNFGSYSKVGDIISFTVLKAGTGYIRWGTAFLSGYTSDNIVITVNEEITA